MARGRNESVSGSSKRERQQGGSTPDRARGTETRSSRGAEQEQQLPVSRESTQRGGTGLSRQEPSLLPSIFAAPPGVLSGAFLSNPFGFMRRMSEEMNRIFESSGMGGLAVTRSGQFGGDQAGLGSWMPPIEVHRTGNELLVRADLPGLKREDVTIEVDDGVLTLSGERRQEDREEREGFYRSERSYGSFFRAIPLPEGVNEDDIEATFGDGVLEVRVPVPEQQQQRRGRRIDIK